MRMMIRLGGHFITLELEGPRSTHIYAFGGDTLFDLQFFLPGGTQMSKDLIVLRGNESWRVIKDIG